MAERFIERRDGGYYLAGSRVSLDSVVYQFLQGESPEGIAQAYPSLSLVQVYGAITFYLQNRAEVDASLRQGERQFDQLRREARQANPLLYEKLDAAKAAKARAG